MNSRLWMKCVALSRGCPRTLGANGVQGKGGPAMASVVRSKRSLTAAVVLLVAATTAALGSFVGPAFATPSINLSPAGPYNDGQMLTVSGSGFPVRSALPTGLQIIECSDPGGLPGNLPTDATSGCDGSTVNGSQINTDVNGHFSATYNVSLLNAGNSTIVCDATHYCALWVGVDYNNAFLSGPHAFSTAFLINSVVQSSQTITFTSTAPSGATVGGTYTPLATASSGLAVNLTIDVSASSVCSISGAVVHFLAVGTCTVDANQAGNNNWLPAAQVQQPFSVSAAASNATVTTTQVSAASVPLSPTGSVSDAATVQGNATYGSPTGTVDFYVCQVATTQTFTPAPCSVGGPSHFSTIHTTPGIGAVSTASSGSFTPQTAGTWCFAAVFTSTGTYTGSSDNTIAGNLDANECVLVTPVSSATVTFVAPVQVTLGPSGTLTDDVTVGGTLAGGAPTGTVTFYACQISTTQVLTPGSCSPTGTPADPGEALVAGVGDTSSAESSAFTPTAVGTWCFAAVYSGDANYTNSSDNTTTPTLDPNECALVGPAGSTTASAVSSAVVALGASSTLTDTVTVTGNSAGGAPAGTVAFYVCGPSTSSGLCTVMTTPVGSPALTANGADTATATSSVFDPTVVGTYCFAAVYLPTASGNYAGSSDNVSGTPDPSECATVALLPYTIISGNSATAVPGQTFSFTVRTNGPSVPKIKKKGALPKALRLVDNHDGTATILGIASAKKVGTFNLSINVTWGKGKAKVGAAQAFTLTVV